MEPQRRQDYDNAVRLTIMQVSEGQIWSSTVLNETTILKFNVSLHVQYPELFSFLYSFLTIYYVMKCKYNMITSLQLIICFKKMNLVIEPNSSNIN